MSFLKVSFLAGTAGLVRTACNLLTNKIFAVFLGAEGFVVLANFQNVIAIYSKLCSASIETGFTKSIAEANFKDDVVSLEQVNINVWRLYAMISMSLFVLLLLGWHYFSKLLAGGALSGVGAFLIMALSGPIYAALSLLVSSANGHKKVREFGFSSVVGSLILLIVSYPLASEFNELGALISLLIGQLCSLVFLFFLMKKSHVLVDVLQGSIDWKSTNELLKFSFMSLVSIITSIGLVYLIRDLVSNTYSYQVAGSWQGIYKLSEVISALVFSSVSFYFVPKFSELNKSYDILKEVIKSSFVLLPAFCVLSLLFYLWSDWIINLLYSNDFLELATYAWIQFLGTGVQLVAWILGLALVVKKMIKSHFLVQLSSVIVTYVCTIYFMDWFGAKGVFYASVIGSVYLLVVNMCALFLARNVTYEE